MDFLSFHSVQGGEMAGLRQNVGKGKGKEEEGLAETIDGRHHSFTTPSSQI